MIKKQFFTSRDLLTRFSDLILSAVGQDCEFDHTASPYSAIKTSLVFLPNLEQAPESAAIIITTQEIADLLNGKTDYMLVCVADVRFAQAKIKKYYDDYQAGDLEWDPIHHSAVIHKSTKLGNHCRVGPNAVIGAHCVIGDHSIIRANAVVEHNVTMGEYCLVHAGANIGYDSQIGDRVNMQPGSIIGGEGFGFATDAERRYHQIPHTGNVILGDDVYVGANSCIDRGTYGSTVIARGVKIDNLVQIAHNVFLDEDCLLVSQTGVAGSSAMGKRVIASGQTGVIDHMTIPDDTILVQRAGVVQDIPYGGMWAGTPAKPFKEWLRGTSAGKKVAKLEKTVKKLESELRAVQEKLGQDN